MSPSIIVALVRANEDLYRRHVLIECPKISSSQSDKYYLVRFPNMSSSQSDKHASGTRLDADIRSIQLEYVLSSRYVRMYCVEKKIAGKSFFKVVSDSVNKE